MAAASARVIFAARFTTPPLPTMPFSAAHAADSSAQSNIWCASGSAASTEASKPDPLGVVGEHRCELLAGDAALGAERAVVIAVCDAHGLGAVLAVEHVGEGGAAIAVVVLKVVGAERAARHAYDQAAAVSSEGSRNFASA